MALLVCLSVQPDVAEAQVIRAFSERVSFNSPGSFVMIGNVLATCDVNQVTTPSCADVQSGAAVGNNGGRNFVFVDVDSDGATTNSSSADLTLPDGASVLYAGLYWGARSATTAGTDTILMQVPGGSYQTITSSQTEQLPIGDSYQSFADVTTQVQGAGEGTYFVADITADLPVDSLGSYAGWSLVVLYEDPSERFRRITLFDGAVAVDGVDDVQTTVSGIQTPLSGDVEAIIGAVVWEGDDQFVGDQLLVQNPGTPPPALVPVSNGLNPQDNWWNSSITFFDPVAENVARFSAKNPDFVNQMALDVDYDETVNLFANNQTSVDLGFTTNGDVFYPHALVFAIDVSSPQLALVGQVLSGEPYSAVGDIVTFQFTATNTGDIDAINAQIALTPMLGNFSCTPSQPFTLTPQSGNSLVCTGEYTVTQADLDSGSISVDGLVTSTDANMRSFEARATVPAQAAPEIEVTPGPMVGVDFGTVLVSSGLTTQTVTVDNVGGATLDLTSISVTGAGFSLENNGCGTTLEPTDPPCTLTIGFTPGGTAGSPTGTLNIQSNDSDEGNLDIPLAATVIDGTLTAVGVDFGTLTVNQTGTGTVVVTNTGTSSLVITGLTGTGALAPFSVVDDRCTGQTVAAVNGTCEIDVSLVSGAAGTFTDSFGIDSDVGGSATADLTGVVNAISANDADVGTLPPDTQGTDTITVTNNGSSSVVITGLGTPTAPFTVVDDGCTGQTLAADGGTCDIVIGLISSMLDTYTGTLDIISDTGGTITANLAGLVANQDPIGIPTLSQWSMMIMAAFLALTAMLGLRRQQS